MGERFVLVEDLHASDIGLDFEMGLLYPKGAIVDNLLPGMDELLLQKGKIMPEADWWKLQADGEKQKSEQQQQADSEAAAAEEEEKAKQAPANKRGRGAPNNKGK